MGSGRKMLLLIRSCWGGSKCGKGECGCTGVPGVTGDIGGGVTDTCRRADGSSNLRAGDFQELVVVVCAVVVFNVVDFVVVVVGVGFTDCNSC